MAPNPFRDVACFIFYRNTSDDDAPTKPTSPPLSDDDNASAKSVSVTPTYRWHHFITNLLALLLSAAAIVAIVLLLRKYEGREAAEGNIGYHATIAWLTTVAKLSLMLPIAECIGQAKWALFNKGRRKLTDMDLADAVSRNALGALGWIVRFRSGVLVHLGAALVIVGLGFEPAMQHLLRYEQRAVVDAAQSMTLAANTNYAPERGLDRGMIYENPQAVLWGAYSAILGQPVPPTFSCSSGNCTIPTTTATVGICSRCSKVTSSLVRDCRDLTRDSPFCHGSACFTTGQLCTYRHSATNATVGGGNTFLNVVAEGLNFESATEGKASISRDVVNLTALFIQPGTEEQPDNGTLFETRFDVAPGHVSARTREHNARAFSCALSYCELRLRSDVVGGKLTERRSVADDSFERLTIEQSSLDDINDELLEQTFNLTRSAASTRVNFSALFGLSRGIANSLTGNSTKLNPLIEPPGAFSAFHQAMYQKLVNASFEDVVEDMAESMTNAIRNDGNAPVRGEVWVQRIFVRVDWAWIAIPGAVWLGALLLLLLATQQARKAHAPWLGTSQLAGMFIDLETQVRRNVDQLDGGWGDKNEMRKVGEKFRVRVAPVHGLMDGRAKQEFSQLSSPL